MAFFIQRVQTSCQGTQKLWKLLQKFIPRLRVPDWNRFAAPWLWCHAHFPVLCLSCDTLLWKRGDLRLGLSFFTSWLSKFCYGNRCMGGDNPGLAGQPILFYSSQFWMADSPSCTPPAAWTSRVEFIANSFKCACEQSETFKKAVSWAIKWKSES